jgi:hypothetical protein
MRAMQITRPQPSRTLVTLLLLGLAGSAGAFHRATPPLVVLTTSGDTDLPRVPSQGRRLLALAAGQEIVTLLPFQTQSEATPLGVGVDPAVAFTGHVVAYTAPDGQIALSKNGNPIGGVPDASGTSTNPSLDKRGETLVFESAGNLTNLLTPDVVNRVYVRYKDGTLALVSSGSGWSGSAMLAAKGGLVAFESTSDPVMGVDTGTKQVWVGRVTSLPAARITDGAGASVDPIVSDDSRVVAFVSTADLAGGGADTGVPQIFVYDTQTQTFAQLTNEGNGCGRPGIAKVGRDWRITFVCDGQAYYHMLRENQRYHVPTPDGSAQSIIPEMGVHFLTVSTTANLEAGSGTTAGHQIYLLNLFKAPVPSVAGSATWFPFQGITGH